MKTSLSTQDRYTRAAIVFHWVIAAIIIFNLAVGLNMESMSGDQKHVWIPLHISFGLTVLLLTLVRIAWRLTHRPPAQLEGPVWAHRAAHLAHLAIYVLMLGLPLTGWAIVSAHPPVGPGGRNFSVCSPSRPCPSCPTWRWACKRARIRLR